MRNRLPHWGNRALSVLLIPLHLASCVPGYVWAAEAPRQPTPVQRAPAAKPAGLQPPPEVLKAASIAPTLAARANREMADVQPPSPIPSFSDNPSDAEIFRLSTFSEPLVPVGSAPDVATKEVENRALAAAMRGYAVKGNRDDVSEFQAFLEQYPQTRWRASLQVNLGWIYRMSGYFSRALKAWGEAWAMTKDEKQPETKMVAGRAISELTELNSRLGRQDELRKTLKEIEGERYSGSAVEKLSLAKQALWLMENKPEESFLCGPMALYRIRALKGESGALHDVIRNARSTANGTSLVQVQGWAKEMGMEYQMAKRESGASVIFPSVVHWKVGHFAAIIKEANGKFLVQDPTFKHNIWVTKSTLDEESSGNYLVPEGKLPTGWKPLGKQAGEKVWGKGEFGCGDPDFCSPCDTKCKKCACDCQPDYAGGPSAEQMEAAGHIGMPRYNVHAMTLGLTIFDTPIAYAAPVGPMVGFTVTYNHRDAAQPDNFTYPHLGPRWTFGWLSYLDTASGGSTNSDALLYVKGGGRETYTAFATPSAAVTIHNSTNSITTNRTDVWISSSQMDNQSRMVRIPAGNHYHYQRHLPSGAIEVFDVMHISGKVFLSKVIDARGNTIQLKYDQNFRLVNIVDAIGQVTTISYTSNLLPSGNASSALFYRIARVEDPFHRSAVFEYDGNGRLRKITDMIGMASEFTYSYFDPNFITDMKTPYGTTHFTANQTIGTGSYAGKVMGRVLEVTDPKGGKERYEFRGDHLSSAGFSHGDPESDTRYTFYWDKKAMAEMIGGVDYNLARWFHWAKTANGTVSHILQSSSEPLEKPVSYEYPGQTDGTSEAGVILSSPSRISHLLDDGTEQAYETSYNSLGRVTNSVDPVGRTMTYIYTNNQMDLYEVRQTTGTNNDLLVRLTYNNAHQPLTVINAAGRTNSFGYNSRGQLTKATNALGQVVTLNYNEDGYLENVQGPIVNGSPASTNSYTYDVVGRMRTMTDSEGYTVSLEYDNLNRLTRVSYPDNTYQQTIYNRLDAEWMQDRMGRWTHSKHDELQQIVEIQDALGRITHLTWCDCGSLESIEDAMNRVTTWFRDIQGRVISKVYDAGGPQSQVIYYGYETNSSRLIAVTNTGGAITRYSYGLDDNLTQIRYTNSAVSTPSVSFTYDPNYGRKMTMVDGTGTNSYEYYPMDGGLGAGKLKQINGPYDGFAIKYQYDELGRVKSRAIDTTTNFVSYDILGRMTNNVNALGNFGYSYVNNTGRLNAMTNTTTGHETKFEYFNNQGNQRLQTIWNKFGDTTLSKFDYTYNAEGQIQTWIQQAGEVSTNTHSFEYDAIEQLLGVTVKGPGGSLLKQFAYGYDTLGNRTSQQTGDSSANVSVLSGAHNELNQLLGRETGGLMRVAGSVNERSVVTVNGTNAVVKGDNSFEVYVAVASGNNTLSVVAQDFNGNVATNRYSIDLAGSVGTEVVTYDGNGNQTSISNAMGVVTYCWDAADRLVGITNGAEVSFFTYDGLGRRIGIFETNSSTHTLSTKRFVWCGTQLCEERDDNNVVTKRFFGEGEQISGTNYFFARDHLGCIRELTDDGGVVRARYDYDPYGKRVKVGGDLEADFGFTGYYFHAASKLHLALFRAYDAQNGRWLSRDPLHEIGGLNLYAYAFNDPIDLIDPLGLSSYGATLVRSSFAAGGMAIGLVLGFVGGGGTGLLGGPVAPVTVPAGAVAGATVGAGVGALAGAVVGDYLANMIDGDSGTGGGGNQRGAGGKGWKGDKNWKDLIKECKKGGDVNLKKNALPTKDEALEILKEAKAKPYEISNGHPPGGVSTHCEPHINFYTESGAKGTIPIQAF